MRTDDNERITEPRAPGRATQGRHDLGAPRPDRLVGALADPGLAVLEALEQRRQRRLVAPVPQALHQLQHDVGAGLHGERLRGRVERLLARGDLPQRP